MISTKLKGLAFITALALTAVIGVGSASASGFVANSYPTAFSGVPTTAHEFSVREGTFKCDGSKFESQVTSPIETLTSGGVYDSNCSFWGGTQMKTNGCQFSFHPGTPSGGKFGGSFDIGPAGCGPITVTGSSCTVSIGAQTGLAATYENVGSGSSATVTVRANATALKYSQSGLCSSTGSFEDGKYSGTWQVSGRDLIAGKPVGIHAAPQQGIYLANEKLEAESYPAAVIGSQEAAKKLTLSTKTGNASCQTASLTGKLTAAAKELSLDGQYEKCTAFGLSATVAMNSCRYVPHLSSGGPPYVGTFDVACAGKGDTIETKVFSCTVKIPAQSGLTGVSFTNVGTGSGRGVSVALSVTGIKYTQAGVFCAGEGTFENGGLTGTAVLYGLN